MPKGVRSVYWVVCLSGFLTLCGCVREDESTCPNGEVITRLTKNDSLHQKLAKSISHFVRPHIFELTDFSNPHFQDTFHYYQVDISWHKAGISVMKKDPCEKVMLSRWLHEMKVPEQEIHHQFYLLESNEEEEELPELFVLYQYKDKVDSGYFKFSEAYTEEMVWSIDNPSLGIRLQKDFGIVQMEWDGVFNIKRYEE